MLYPDFAELIKLQAASTGGLLKNKYSQRSITAGDYSSLFRGQGMELDSIRPYVIGDDIRSIDWRVSARTNKVHVKTFQAESDRKVMLVVDSNAYMRFGTRGTFKSIQAARAAALLAGMGFKNRDRVGGMVFGDIEGEVKFFPPTRNKTSVWKFLQLLCAVNEVKKSAVNLAYALQQLQHNLSTGALIFLLSDISAILATKGEIFAALKAKADLIFLPIIDPIDSALPELSNIICTNNLDKKITIGNVSNAMRLEYAQQWLEEQQKLNCMLEKYKIKLINLYTNQAVHRSLNDGLQCLRCC